MVCSNCKAPVREGSKFCQACGAPVMIQPSSRAGSGSGSKPAGYPEQRRTAGGSAGGSASPYRRETGAPYPDSPFGRGPAPKSNKKLIIGIISAVLLIGLGIGLFFIIRGCGGGNSYKLVRGNFQGIQIDMSNSEALEALGVKIDIRLVLNSDDTLDMIVKGEAYGQSMDESVSGTWKDNGDGTLSLTIDGDTQIARKEGNQLILSVSGQEMIFEK